MTPKVEILQGNILDLAPGQIAAGRQVHAIICSPPYYGLRDYKTASQVWDGDPACDHDWQVMIKKGISGGTKSAKVQTKGSENFQIVPDKEQAICTTCGAWRGDLGQEPTPADFVRHLVQIFETLKPLLHDSGTLWVNLADSYAANRSYQVPSTKGGPKHGSGQAGQTSNRVPPGMKSKDLMGVPWTFALAMRAAGWYLRADIIWAKRNPMPESMEDRPTKSHEYIFLFSKQEQYFFDHLAAREPVQSGPSDIKKMREGLARIGGKHKDLDDPLNAADRRSNIGKKRGVGDPSGRNMRSVQWDESNSDLLEWLKGQPEVAVLAERYAQARRIESVFDIPTAPYRGAHFATWPPRLAERMIKAATSEKGVCPGCLWPWRRILDGVQTIGWEPSCQCKFDCAVEPIPATVLDPFTGSGTTLVVARLLGRDSLGFELNPQYVALAHDRLKLPFDWGDTESKTESIDYTDLPLFQGVTS